MDVLFYASILMFIMAIILYMWDDIKKVKPTKQNNSKNIQQRKEEYRRKKKVLDDLYEPIKLDSWDKERTHIREKKEKCANKNQTCPKCGSKNVHLEYKRIIGSLDGSIAGNGHGSSLFGSGHYSSSLNGNVHGELDTFKVNKCSDCEEEWEHIDIDNIKPDKYYSGSIDFKNDAYMIAYELDKIIDVHYDPNDIKEKYDSYEDKYADALESFKKSIKTYFDRYKYIELLFYIMADNYYDIPTDRFDNIVDGYYHKNSYESKCNCLDKYLGSFTPEIVKLLENVGFKHIVL